MILWKAILTPIYMQRMREGNDFKGWTVLHRGVHLRHSCHSLGAHIMTLPVPRAVREFVDGVRIIRESLPALFAVERTLGKVMRAIELNEIEDLYDILEAERASRSRATDEANELARACESVRRELETETTATARKEAERKLDALTRWNLTSETPCPITGIDQMVSWSADCSDISGTCFPINLDESDYWRHTPESLDAMEKAKSDG
jgi:hypothetical protein